jgi:hypothetical protein
MTVLGFDGASVCDVYSMPASDQTKATEVVPLYGFTLKPPTSGCGRSEPLTQRSGKEVQVGRFRSST